MAKETLCRSAASKTENPFLQASQVFKYLLKEKALPGPGRRCALTSKTLPVDSAAERAPLLTRRLRTVPLRFVVRENQSQETLVYEEHG